MEVIIEGHQVNIPYCTCGKCLVIRSRKDALGGLPYNKNLNSVYSQDFGWKSPGSSSSPVYNKAKHSAFEDVYKEHLPTGLLSTMKLDYKPFLVKMEETKNNEMIVKSIPFIGRSTNSCMFPGWGSSKLGNADDVACPEIKVPLRGKSNYKENYERYEPRFYSERQSPVIARPTLGFFGQFNGETSFKNSYVPIDLNQPHYFPKGKKIKAVIEKSQIINPPLPKSNFLSNYEQSFFEYKDKICLLREHLKSRGLNSLKI